MPAINVNAPNKLPGILGSVMRASSMKRGHMKTCIYGRNRIGKSTLAVQFPKPLLYMACEPTENGGTDSIIGTEGVDIVVISLKKRVDPTTRLLEEYSGRSKALNIAIQLQEMYDRTGSCYYNSVAVDSTALQEIVLAEIMGWDEVDKILAWGSVGRERYMERADKTREVLRAIAALPTDTIFVAQEKDHNPPKGDEAGPSKVIKPAQEKSFMAANLGGSTVEWLHDACGFICQLYMEAETKTETSFVEVAGERKSEEITTQTGRFVRRLRTAYHPNYAAGVRTPRPDVVPEYIEAETPQQMYEDLVRISMGVRALYGKYRSKPK